MSKIRIVELESDVRELSRIQDREIKIRKGGEKM